MKPIILPFFLALTMILSACAPQTQPAARPKSIVLTDCVLSSPGTGKQVTAQCGTLPVPEDPAKPEGREIDLHIAVVPAIKRIPEPDPLFVLAGGPGQSITEAFPALNDILYQIHEKRDIVLVDQRGTGKSNPLRCLDPDDETLKDDEAIRLLKACPAKLDADLRYYTTDIAMQDLDRVRAALGYQTINLYGVSYGTRAALVYLKMFPERVRSLILDAVLDPAFVLYRDAPRDGQRALDLFFARCTADKACHSTFPNLKSEFDAVLQRVEQTSVNITIAHPISGKPLALTLTRVMLTNIIFNTLYAPDLVATLPFAIHQAYAEGNYAPLITETYLVDAGIYDGMFYAVACTEDAPLIRAQDLNEQSADSLFGPNAKTFLEVCAAWPHGDPPEVVHSPVSSGVPVLMLSGEADPITPPWHAQQLAGSLDNDMHLVFRNMGHGNSNSQCAIKIIGKFVETASLRDLETDCVKEVEPPPFFVDFSGPQP